MADALPRIVLRFDAGTLLIEGLLRDAVPEHRPPEALWDERVGRYRAPAFRYRELVTLFTRLARAGAVEFDDRARRYKSLTLTHLATRAAFDHQKEAVSRWEAHGITRTMLWMLALRLGYRLGVDPDRLARAYLPRSAADPDGDQPGTANAAGSDHADQASPRSR